MNNQVSQQVPYHEDWVQLALFPLPKVNYFRPVPAIPSIPRQMTYVEWVKYWKISSNDLSYVEYIDRLHTEHILWERWCGHGE